MYLKMISLTQSAHSHCTPSSLGMSRQSDLKSPKTHCMSRTISHTPLGKGEGAGLGSRLGSPLGVGLGSRLGSVDGGALGGVLGVGDGGVLGSSDGGLEKLSIELEIMTGQNSPSSSRVRSWHRAT